MIKLNTNNVFVVESLAKMRLAAFATGRDIDEALRLFKGSTMAAASTGALSGVEGIFFKIYQKISSFFKLFCRFFDGFRPGRFESYRASDQTPFPYRIAGELI